MAAGTAAALAAPASALAASRPARGRSGGSKGAASTKPPAAGRPGARVALPAEIEKQKKGTLDSVKTLRNFPLPAGSPQALLFRPLVMSRKMGSD
jgi:hypothetical protein